MNEQIEVRPRMPTNHHQICKNDRDGSMLAAVHHSDRAQSPTPPHNIEVEQALLGAIFLDNKAFDFVSSFLMPDHFCDPLHARIYEVVAGLIREGTPAQPTTVK